LERITQEKLAAGGGGSQVDSLLITDLSPLDLIRIVAEDGYVYLVEIKDVSDRVNLRGWIVLTNPVPSTVVVFGECRLDAVVARGDRFGFRNGANQPFYSRKIVVVEILERRG
jgi:hypothetical protein